MKRKKTKKSNILQSLPFKNEHFFILCACIFFLVCVKGFATIPFPERMVDYPSPGSLLITDRNNVLLYKGPMCFPYSSNLFQAYRLADRYYWFSNSNPVQKFVTALKIQFFISQNEKDIMEQELQEECSQSSEILYAKLPSVIILVQDKLKKQILENKKQGNDYVIISSIDLEIENILQTFSSESKVADAVIVNTQNGEIIGVIGIIDSSLLSHFSIQYGLNQGKTSIPSLPGWYFITSDRYAIGVKKEFSEQTNKLLSLVQKRLSSITSSVKR